MGCSLMVLLVVCMLSKNLKRIHHNDGTNMHMQYLVYNYHKLLQQLLDMDLYYTISLHVDCCITQEEVSLILEVEEELDFLDLDIKVAEEIALEVMVNIEETILNLLVDKIKKVMLNKLEPIAETMVELELKVANLNIQEGILMLEAIQNSVLEVRQQVNHTKATEQAIHIVNQDKVAFLAILAIIKLLNFVIWG